MTDLSIRPPVNPNVDSFNGVGSTDKSGTADKTDRNTQVAPNSTSNASGSKKGIDLNPTNAKPDASAFQSLLSTGGDISIGSVMKLLIELGQKNWQSNMENRQSELDAQVASINKQAEKMRGGAMLNLIMGVVFGAVGIIGGIVNIVGSVKAFKAQKSAGAEIKQQKQLLNESKKELNDVNKQVSASKEKINNTLEKMKTDGDITELFPEFKKSSSTLKGLEKQASEASAVVAEHKEALKEANTAFKAASKQLEVSEKKWQSSGGTLGSVGKIGEGAAQGGSQIIQSQSKLEEAEQANHQAKMQQANDYIQHYNSMIRDVRNLIAQINQDVNQTARSVLNKA